MSFTAFLLAAVAMTAATALVFWRSLRRRDPAGAALTRRDMNTSIYRDQLRELEADLAAGTISTENYDSARRDIERRLLDDVGAPAAAAAAPVAPGGRKALAATAIAVPLAAALVYFTVGGWELFRGDTVTPRTAAHDQAQVQAMVAALATRLKEQPDDPQGWRMLARSYAVMQRYPEAVKAYQETMKRMEPDAQVLADYADVLGMAQERRLEGEPERYIQRALALDPNNIKALALAGTVAFDRADYPKAIAHWERLVAQADADDNALVQSIRGGIAEARERSGTKGKMVAAAPPAAVAPSVAPSPATPAPAGPAARSIGKAVQGVIELVPALKTSVGPGDTLFVFARAVDGPRMPVAILRAQVQDLPLKFSLDDSHAMSPAMKLSDQKQVIIGARISKSGVATGQAGDLEGFSQPVAVGATDVRVTVDAVRR
jgi:cytochrome c-type biogenesis protein CcmH